VEGTTFGNNCLSAIKLLLFLIVVLCHMDRSKMDINSIENVLVSFSHLVSEKWMGIKEVEVNPLLVSNNR
jgi:hypothetical protein